MMPSTLLHVSRICLTSYFLLISADALAFEDGVISQDFLDEAPPNCNGCHDGGAPPVVALSADRDMLGVGESVMLTFTVATDNGNPGAAGFNLRADQPGTFEAVDLGGGSADGIRIRNVAGSTEATHVTPQPGEPATFVVSWTPNDGALSGTVTFTAWGNSVNFDGDNGGDAAAMDTLQLDLMTCTPTTWYRDGDGDGHGAMSSGTMMACTAPDMFVASNDDCDDTSAMVSPDAVEVCNDADDDCNGQIDDNAGCAAAGGGGAGGGAGTGGAGGGAIGGSAGTSANSGAGGTMAPGGGGTQVGGGGTQAGGGAGGQDPIGVPGVSGDPSTSSAGCSVTNGGEPGSLAWCGLLLGLMAFRRRRMRACQ